MNRTDRARLNVGLHLDEVALAMRCAARRIDPTQLNATTLAPWVLLGVPPTSAHTIALNLIDATVLAQPRTRCDRCRPTGPLFPGSLAEDLTELHVALHDLLDTVLEAAGSKLHTLADRIVP